MAIDHVGVVVDDLVEACALLEQLGLVETARIDRPDLRAVFLALGCVQIEVIEVLEAEARRQRLGNRRAVVEHIALAVESLDGAVEGLRALGVELNGPPRLARGARTAFVDPATSDGIPLQLVERAPQTQTGPPDSAEA